MYTVKMVYVITVNYFLWLVFSNIIVNYVNWLLSFGYCCNVTRVIWTLSSVLFQNDHIQEPHHNTSSSNLPSNQVVEQLKYENDRLKIALAQRSVETIYKYCYTHILIWKLAI